MNQEKGTCPCCRKEMSKQEDFPEIKQDQDEDEEEDGEEDEDEQEDEDDIPDINEPLHITIVEGERRVYLFSSNTAASKIQSAWRMKVAAQTLVNMCKN